MEAVADEIGKLLKNPITNDCFRQFIERQKPERVTWIDFCDKYDGGIETDIDIESYEFPKRVLRKGKDAKQVRIQIGNILEKAIDAFLGSSEFLDNQDSMTDQESLNSLLGSNLTDKSVDSTKKGNNLRDSSKSVRLSKTKGGINVGPMPVRAVKSLRTISVIDIAESKDDSSPFSGSQLSTAQPPIGSEWLEVSTTPITSYLKKVVPWRQFRCQINKDELLIHLPNYMVHIELSSSFVSSCSNGNLDKDNELRYAFKVETNHWSTIRTQKNAKPTDYGEETFVFRCNDEISLNEWLVALRQAISNASKQRIGKGSVCTMCGKLLDDKQITTDGNKFCSNACSTFHMATQKKGFKITAKDDGTRVLKDTVEKRKAVVIPETKKGRPSLKRSGGSRMVLITKEAQEAERKKKEEEKLKLKNKRSKEEIIQMVLEDSKKYTAAMFALLMFIMSYYIGCSWHWCIIMGIVWIFVERGLRDGRIHVDVPWDPKKKEEEAKLAKARAELDSIEGEKVEEEEILPTREELYQAKENHLSESEKQRRRKMRQRLYQVSSKSSRVLITKEGSKSRALKAKFANAALRAVEQEAKEKNDEGNNDINDVQNKNPADDEDDDDLGPQLKSSTNDSFGKSRRAKSARFATSPLTELPNNKSGTRNLLGVNKNDNENSNKSNDDINNSMDNSSASLQRPNSSRLSTQSVPITGHGNNGTTISAPKLTEQISINRSSFENEAEAKRQIQNLIKGIEKKTKSNVKVPPPIVVESLITESPSGNSNKKEANNNDKNDKDEKKDGDEEEAPKISIPVNQFCLPEVPERADHSLDEIPWRCTALLIVHFGSFLGVTWLLICIVLFHYSQVQHRQRRRYCAVIHHLNRLDYYDPAELIHINKNTTSHGIGEKVINQKKELEKISSTPLEWPSWLVSPDNRPYWLNRYAHSLWPAMNERLCEDIRGSLDPLLDYYRPAMFKKFCIARLSFGAEPLSITAIRTVDCDMEGLVLDLDVRFAGDSSQILEVLAATKMFAKAKARLTELWISGTLRMRFHTPIALWPCFKFIDMAFLTRPKFDFRLKMSGGLEFTLIPGMKGFLQNTLASAMQSSFVWPNYVPVQCCWEEHEVEELARQEEEAKKKAEEEAKLANSK